MRIHIATDHAGLEFSTQLQHHLAGAGTRRRRPRSRSTTTRSTTTPRSASAPRRRSCATRRPASRRSAIVFGGSGNGEQIAANKVRGIRAALVWSIATAELAREHNDANVIAIGARQHTFDEATTFIDRFIATPFSQEERHARRIAQIAAFEEDGALEPDPARHAGAPGRARRDDSSFDPEAG